MHLLHVAPTYLPAIRYGGPIVAVHGLCRALAARGHTVEVFTTSIDGPRDSPVPHGVPVTIDGVAVRYFASKFLRRLSWAPELASALRPRIALARIVHLHSVFLWPTWAAARLAAAARVPYVVSPRGMMVPALIAGRHRLLKTAWIRLIEKSNLENAAAIHVTSAVEAAALREFGFCLDRVAVVPNGIDEVEPAASGAVPDDIAGLAGEGPLILYLGRIAWVKGLDRLLRGFARTRAGRLAIVGNDDGHMVPKLASLARRLGIAERVIFVPRSVTGADRERVFAAARAFVLPSLSESFGNAALEAMQRGLPVVVTADAGVSEIVCASGGGVVVGGDPQELGAALDRIVQDPAAARAIGDAGQRYVRRNCGWDQVAAAMEALYETAAAGAPARA